MAAAPPHSAQTKGHNSRIAAFNEQLVSGGRQILFHEYFWELNAAVFKKEIESFARDLLNLPERDDCCIPTTKLCDYGILAAENSTQQALQLFKEYELVEGADFQMSDAETPEGSKQCLITPRSFEECLMRTEHTFKYVEFYCQLTKSLKAYSRYQAACDKRFIITMTKRCTEEAKDDHTAKLL